jgi:hypothetical protein
MVAVKAKVCTSAGERVHLNIISHGRSQAEALVNRLYPCNRSAQILIVRKKGGAA